MDYRIQHAGCQAFYIGQTGHRLKQRLDEHKRAIRQAKSNTSPLAEHAWTEKHQVDYIGLVLQ